ncbi:MAG: hypothetical protein SGPRY_002825 [Prymnesium sp.]
MCTFTCALALALCLIYNPIRKDVREGGKRTLLYYIFHDCDSFWAMLTTFVTFVLGFFNSNVFQRWWRLRELCGTVNGRTVDTTVLLASYVSTEAELNDLIRILWLAHALHVESVAMKRAPNADVVMRLHSQGLIKAPAPASCHFPAANTSPENLGPLTDRARAGDSAGLPDSHVVDAALDRLWLVYRQIRASDEEYGSVLPFRPAAARAGRPSNQHFRQMPAARAMIAGLSSQGNVSAMRGAASDCLMYLSTPVPLAYTHLVDMMVTIYVLMAPVGLMLNPFDAHQSDSFETNSFLRGTRMACLEVVAAVHNYNMLEEDSISSREIMEYEKHKSADFDAL